MSARPEHLRALREGAAVAVPGLRGVLGVLGEDRRAWLDRIASTSLRDLLAGRAACATFLDGKGKLRADVRVLLPPGMDEWLLDVPAAGAERLLRTLDMYVIKDRVTLRDLSGARRWVSVLGPRAPDLLRALGLGEAEAGRVLEPQPDLLLLESLHYGVPGADLLLPALGVATLLDALVAAGAVEVDPAALDVVRLEHGVPWLARDMSGPAGEVIPLEAGLDAWVSVTKGCYPGQEVVARITNLGQVARKLVRLRAGGEHELAPGTPLEHEGKAVGVLTSAAPDPTQRATFALGYVRRAAWNEGTRLAAGGVELIVGLPASLPVG